MGRYFTHLGEVLFAHHWHWYASLVVAYMLGIGVFADYANVRDRINAVQSLIELPNEFPIWLVIIPFLVWVIASTAYRDTIRANRQPRLIFDEPVAHAVPLTAEDADPTGAKKLSTKLIILGSIAVRNNPLNREEGRQARDAHATVEFYSASDGSLLRSMKYPRWTDNDKPRPDSTPTYMPMPRYKVEWNFRTIEPNNAANNIDFVLKDTDSREIFGFMGSSQQNRWWQAPGWSLGERKMRIRIIIEASGMERPAETELYLTDLGPGAQHFHLHSAKSIEWMNWVGIG